MEPPPRRDSTIEEMLDDLEQCKTCVYLTRQNKSQLLIFRQLRGYLLSSELSRYLPR
jgi:hypothetical protein